MVASFAAPTKSSALRQEEQFGHQFGSATSSAKHPPQDCSRVLDLCSFAYAAHGASLLGIQARANTKYKVAHKLVEEHKLKYFGIPNSGLHITQQYDEELNTREAFVTREQIMMHPRCRAVLSRWWHALSGGSDKIDKSDYFGVGSQMIQKLLPDCTEQEVTASLEEDWNEDRDDDAASDAMRFPEFQRSLLELADVWVPDLKVDSVVDFLTQMCIACCGHLPPPYPPVPAQVNDHLPTADQSAQTTAGKSKDGELENSAGEEGQEIPTCTGAEEAKAAAREQTGFGGAQTEQEAESGDPTAVLGSFTPRPLQLGSSEQVVPSDQDTEQGGPSDQAGAQGGPSDQTIEQVVPSDQETEQGGPSDQAGARGDPSDQAIEQVDSSNQAVAPGAQLEVDLDNKVKKRKKKAERVPDKEKTAIVLSLAEEIMQTCDQICSNRELSVNEISTFTRGTPHEAFSEWLLENKHKRYRKYDQNHSGNLNFDELCAAVDDFLVDASEDVEPDELQTAMEMNMQQVKRAIEGAHLTVANSTLYPGVKLAPAPLTPAQTKAGMAPPGRIFTQAQHELHARKFHEAELAHAEAAALQIDSMQNKPPAKQRQQQRHKENDVKQASPALQVNSMQIKPPAKQRQQQCHQEKDIKQTSPALQVNSMHNKPRAKQRQQRHHQEKDIEQTSPEHALADAKAAAAKLRAEGNEDEGAAADVMVAKLEAALHAHHEAENLKKEAELAHAEAAALQVNSMQNKPPAKQRQQQRHHQENNIKQAIPALLVDSMQIKPPAKQRQQQRHQANEAIPGVQGLSTQGLNRHVKKGAVHMPSMPLFPRVYKGMSRHNYKSRRAQRTITSPHLPKMDSYPRPLQHPHTDPQAPRAVRHPRPLQHTHVRDHLAIPRRALEALPAQPGQIRDSISQITQATQLRLSGFRTAQATKRNMSKTKYC